MATKTKYRALVRIDYPANQRSYTAILNAGGLSKMDEQQRAAVKMAHAEPGEILTVEPLPCHRDHWLRLGAIEKVKPAKKAAKKKTTKRKG